MILYYEWRYVNEKGWCCKSLKEKPLNSKPVTTLYFLVWRVFHNSTHKVCAEQSLVTLSLVQKQITSVEAMRSLYLLGFFVLFASLQPSLGGCGPFFQLREGNVVGRGFKNWDNYTQYKCVVHDNWRQQGDIYALLLFSDNKSSAQCINSLQWSIIWFKEKNRLWEEV